MCTKRGPFRARLTENTGAKRSHLPVELAMSNKRPLRKDPYKHAISQDTR